MAMPGSEAPSNDSALASGSSSDQGPGGGAADSTARSVDGGSVTAVLDLEGVRRKFNLSRQVNDGVNC